MWRSSGDGEAEVAPRRPQLALCSGLVSQEILCDSGSVKDCGHGDQWDLSSSVSSCLMRTLCCVSFWFIVSSSHLQSKLPRWVVCMDSMHDVLLSYVNLLVENA